MALVHKTLLGLVCAGRARGVEAELIAVLALLFELLGIAADDDHNVWNEGQISIDICSGGGSRPHMPNPIETGDGKDNTHRGR